VRWIRVIGLLVAALWPGGARADDFLQPADHIEAVQQRAWLKRNSLMLEPESSIAFNDPFLLRGGGGLRAVYWVRSLLGLSVDASGWGQTPTPDAYVAQRELHAQIRPAASAWSVLAGAEVTPIDGKVGAGSSIVPFEMFLRLGVGAAATSEAITGAPTFAFSAALGVRWFFSNRIGFDTSFSWHTASITRSIAGVSSDWLDSVVSFEVGMPFRIGGGPP
jgi:hypothetical protein